MQRGTEFVNPRLLLGSRFDLPFFKSQNTVLMGPWCVPLPSDEFFHEHLAYEMITPKWNTSEGTINSPRVVTDFYERVLAFLTGVLNETHNRNYSVRFWRIVIGPWLNYFTKTCYDKYMRLAQVQKIGLNTFVGLSPTEGSRCIDTVDFCSSINHKDSYNLQISTFFANLMGFHIVPSHTKESLSTLQDKLKYAKRKIGWKLNIFNKIQSFFYPQADVVLYGSYHTPFFTKKLFLKSRLKIVDFPASSYEEHTYSNNEYIRDRFLQNINKMSFRSENDFESLFIQSIKHFLPLCFVDGLTELEKRALQRFKGKLPKKIVSAQRWYFDELFKFWAAHSCEHGTTLVGLQHGGNYGAVEHLWEEEHEIKITDQFLTWGWEDKKQLHVQASPSQKFVVPPIAHSKQFCSQDILYVGTSLPRFLVEQNNSGDAFLVYLNNMTCFLEELPLEIREKVRVRLHPEENIWEIKARLLERFPDLRFDDYSIPYYESLSNCKLVVCDHLSTTYLEDFIADVPTVLFWDKDANPLRRSAQPYFDKLQAIGVLYENGRDAARFCSATYNKIEAWWTEPNRQKEISNFCHRFAKRSNSPAKEWLSILLKTVKRRIHA